MFTIHLWIVLERETRGERKKKNTLVAEEGNKLRLRKKE